MTTNDWTRPPTSDVAHAMDLITRMIAEVVAHFTALSENAAQALAIIIDQMKVTESEFAAIRSQLEIVTHRMDRIEDRLDALESGVNASDEVVH